MKVSETVCSYGEELSGLKLSFSSQGLMMSFMNSSTVA